MLLARGQTIADVDAVELRKLLRRLVESAFTAKGFAEIAAESFGDDPELLERLERDGLVAPDARLESGPIFHGEDEDHLTVSLWQLSVAGNALVKARVGSPMPRRQAEALLAGVVDRAKIINVDPDCLFYVETIELFGSLTDPQAAEVGDVDVRVLVSRRLEFDARANELVHRWPGGVVNAAVSATAELRRRLAGGSRKIDIQLDEIVPRSLPDGADPVVVFERSDGE